MKLTLCASLFLSLNLFANEYDRSICGKTDDRIQSNEPRVGRVIKKLDEAYGCSGGLIGKNCFLTAGHCKDYLKFVEFNVPSMSGVNSSQEDTYEVASFKTGKDTSRGSDWAVLKLSPNSITGINAGDLQGHYNYSDGRVTRGTIVRITGHGVDKNDPDWSFTQQTHSGVIRNWLKKDMLKYTVDTTGGNSGSVVIDESTEEVIGIHTNGGCYGSYEKSTNYGTPLGSNTELLAAIRECLND